ncbi:hypothetical protein GA0115253_100413 [Streptomyces sp. Termitarium-T10T-6]|nr:hypothetical protein GA0115253_100413 [Streptomyces sp. Termitarium-T10T-6]
MTFSAASPQVFKAVPVLGAELAQLIALIFTVNAWNRMNVTTRKTPGTP